MDDAEFIDDKEEEYDDDIPDIDINDPEYELALIERRFNITIAEIEENPETAQYSEEFTKLWEKYFETYKDYKELKTKYDELFEDNQEKTKEIELRIKLTETDQSTIEEMKNEIQRSYRLTDAAHSREQIAQETIVNLSRQIESLNHELELKNKISQESDHNIGGALNKKQQALIREKERLISEVTQLNKKLQNALEYQADLEKRTTEDEIKMTEMSETIENHIRENESLKRAKDKLDGDITELNYLINDKDIQIENMDAKIQSHLKNIKDLNTQIKEEHNAKEKLTKDFTILSDKYTKLQDNHNLTIAQFEKFQKLFNKQSTDLKEKMIEINELKHDLHKLKKQKESADKQIYRLETEKFDLIKTRNELKDDIKLCEKEIDDFKRKAANDQKQISNLNKEKELLVKTVIKHENTLKEQTAYIQISEQNKRKLETDLDNMTAENQKNLKAIKHLDFEKSRLVEETLVLNEKIGENLDEIKLKKVEIEDLKKNLNDTVNKLNQEHSLYETARAERNAFEKTLQETLNEAEQLKEKLKIDNRQIEQMKEDLTVKEEELIKEEKLYKKLLREKENIKAELNAANETIKALKFEISELEAEEKRLHKTIVDNNRLIKDQSKTIEGLMNERDLLGSQIVRRNDEISLLNEKIEIFQSTLVNGEREYEQRIRDIKLLKTEIKRLRQEKNIDTKTIKSSVDLKREILLLERDLTKLRLRCRALEDELQNPMNVHRWRKLEGSDPNAFELLKKVQMLQKRLFKQSNEAVEREKCLKQTEELYLNLKQALAKQPSPLIQDELHQTKRALKEQEKHTKCLISELNMAELHVKEYQSDLQRITEELNDLKRKYIALKKSQRVQAMPAQNFNQDINGSYNTGNNQTKFFGGGFRMSTGNSL